MEGEVVSLDGAKVYLKRVLPYRTTAGTIDGVVVTFIDITERKRAEEALKEREEIYRVIVSNAADGIVLIDPETLALGRVQRRSLFPPSAIPGRSSPPCRCRDIHSPRNDRGGRHWGAKSLGTAGIDRRIYHRHRHKDGSLRQVQVSSQYVPVRGKTFLVSGLARCDPSQAGRRGTGKRPAGSNPSASWPGGSPTISTIS